MLTCMALDETVLRPDGIQLICSALYLVNERGQFTIVALPQKSDLAACLADPGCMEGLDIRLTLISLYQSLRRGVTCRSVR